MSFQERLDEAFNEAKTATLSFAHTKGREDLDAVVKDVDAVINRLTYGSVHMLLGTVTKPDGNRVENHETLECVLAHPQKKFKPVLLYRFCVPVSRHYPVLLANPSLAGDFLPLGDRKALESIFLQLMATPDTSFLALLLENGAND